MRVIALVSFIFSVLLLSHAASAQVAPQGNRCAKYLDNDRFMKAIETVATNAMWSLEEMCHLERIWDIQADSADVVNMQGEVEPHVRVYLHRAEDSCLYMVRDADQVVTSKDCFSTF